MAILVFDNYVNKNFISYRLGSNKNFISNFLKKLITEGITKFHNIKALKNGKKYLKKII